MPFCLALSLYFLLFATYSRKFGTKFPENFQTTEFLTCLQSPRGLPDVGNTRQFVEAIHGNPRITDSSSRKAVSFSSARTSELREKPCNDSVSDCCAVNVASFQLSQKIRRIHSARLSTRQRQDSTSTPGVVKSTLLNQLARRSLRNVKIGKQLKC
jgi:hypothetical protein